MHHDEEVRVFSRPEELEAWLDGNCRNCTQYSEKECLDCDIDWALTACFVRSERKLNGCVNINIAIAMGWDEDMGRLVGRCRKMTPKEGARTPSFYFPRIVEKKGEGFVFNKGS